MADASVNSELFWCISHLLHQLKSPYLYINIRIQKSISWRFICHVVYFEYTYANIEAIIYPFEKDHPIDT